MCHWSANKRFCYMSVPFVKAISNYMLKYCTKLLSWYFIYYNYKYARWLTIHWFNLYTTETKFSNVYNFLSKGNFSFQMCHWKFSIMVWIKFMSRIISLAKGVAEQVIYLTRWTIQPLIARKIVVPNLSV